jgi:hypothetical protein
MVYHNSSELDFATSLRTRLLPSGEVRLEYITAELQPFSNQQRPDIIFTPRSGGYVGQNVFIEIKFSTKSIHDGRWLRALVEHREFAAEALGIAISQYFYVTEVAIPEFSKTFLEQHGIYVIDSVRTETELLEQLRASGIVPAP